MSTAPFISVVDDDVSVRESLDGLFLSMGFEVGTFASAEEFLSSDARHKSDCLVLDIAMPGMSGLDLTQLLKTSDTQIPVILITAGDGNELRESALKRGASAFLVKPFADEDLLNAVQAALGRMARSTFATTSRPSSGA